MRIALVVPGFSADEEDWAIPCVQDLVQALAEGHELEIFALRYPSRNASYEVFGVRVDPLRGGLSGGVSRAPLIGRAVAHIMERARRRSFDLVHGLWADEPGAVAAIAAGLLRVPALVSLMGGELVAMRDIGYGAQLSRANRLLLRFALSRATKVTVGSSYLLRLAMPRVRSGRLTLLPLGVDTRRFRPDGPSRQVPVTGERPLLHVASLSAVKDQSTLLRAVAIVARAVPGVHLNMVGDGPRRSALEELTRKLGLTSQVTFHGAVRHQQIPDYYRAAEICLTSSRFESVGMTVLEAGACGRSTIGTSVGVLPELHPATRSVAVRDASALARCITETLLEPGRTAEMGRNCLSMVRRQFNLEAATAAHIRTYAELLAKRS